MNWKTFSDGFWCGANPLVSVAWLLYGIGHLCSLALNKRDSERWFAFWYTPYNRMMYWSLLLQGKSRCGPWSSDD